MTGSRKFPRASHQSRVSTSSIDWLTVSSVSLRLVRVITLVLRHWKPLCELISYFYHSKVDPVCAFGRQLYLVTLRVFTDQLSVHGVTFCFHVQGQRRRLLFHVAKNVEVHLFLFCSCKGDLDWKPVNINTGSVNRYWTVFVKKHHKTANQLSLFSNLRKLYPTESLKFYYPCAFADINPFHNIYGI